MRRAALLLVLSAAVLLSCKRELTAEQEQQLGNLRHELGRLDEAIASAKAEDERLAGGLVKALIAVRLEVLQTNRELINQRIHAIESGAEIETKVQAVKPDLARAAEIAAEIRTQEQELARSKAKAEEYGGLVGAMAAASVATQEQTLAMLKQSYLQAKYGLFYPAVASGLAESASVKTDRPSAAAAPSDLVEPTAPKFQIVNVDSRVTESNDVWSKYAWQVTVKNLTDQQLRLDITVEFLDAQGFVVDDDSENNLALDPYEEATFRDYDLVTASVAGSISKVNAKVGVH
jgi:hypothetical protein